MEKSFDSKKFSFILKLEPTCRKIVLGSIFKTPPALYLAHLTQFSQHSYLAQFSQCERMIVTCNSPFLAFVASWQHLSILQIRVGVLRLLKRNKKHFLEKRLCHQGHYHGEGVRRRP